MKQVTAFASGLLFGVGLAVSGMTEPRNVIGFLDLSGDWNPSLAAVMGGAVVVHAALLQWQRRSPRPAAPLPPTPGLPIDARLLAGAGIFGIGWGLAGYCPGPAIVSLGSGNPLVFLFVLAVVGGVLLADASTGPSSEIVEGGKAPVATLPPAQCGSVE